MFKSRVTKITIVMYKDYNNMFVVIHNDHVIYRGINLAVADRSYRLHGGK